MGEKRRQKIYRIIMLIIVVALVTFIVTTVLTYNGSIRYVVSTKNKPGNSVARKIDALLATVTELINEKYIGDVNEEELIDGALKGLVDSVGDTYTEYYSKEELEDFKANTLGNFVGIGVYMKANFEKNVVEIVEPIDNSPAKEAGLQAGDEILKADGKEYKAEDLEKLSNNIKGEEGTEVTLTIKRGEEVFDITVKRRNVHIKYVESEMLEESIRIYRNIYI
ncbi:MAG: PDZ domain-containing protein [Clostridia bacterium]|nr:PDZ domain-containing protein [Clostridia bacterium]